MKFTKKKVLFIVIISVVVCVLSLGTVSIVSFAMYKAEKKAIIILPGLFASGLYNEETGEGVWDPLEGMVLNFGDFMNADGSIAMENVAPLIFKKPVLAELQKIIAENGEGSEDSVLNIMAMNDDGTPAASFVKGIPWTSEGRLKFGVINAQKEMYESINDNFGDDYIVEIFNYDFRLNNRFNAELLETYINDNGFTEVILVSHSNGGEVAACYLARSEANRNKVSKYISYNSPYYGSFSAINILENVDGMIEGLRDTLNDLNLGFIANKIDTVFDIQFKKLLNMWPVYQLLPSFELLTTEYNGETAGYYLDGERMTFENEEALWEFYCSRPWAKLANGDLKVQLEQWLDFRASMKVELPNGEKVFSTTLVDTVYFIGENIASPNTVQFVTNSENDEIVLASNTTTTHGDGTVLLPSAVVFEKDTNRIVLVDGVDHYGVNKDFYGCVAASTEATMSSHIKSNKKWYNKLWTGILS